MEAVVRNDPLLKLASYGRELEFEDDWNTVEKFQMDISTCLKIEEVVLEKESFGELQYLARKMEC